MSLSKKQITLFQQKILSWYVEHKRDLPWREIPDGISLQDRAYRVLVSEVMLQQTQVSRVVPKYHAWIAALPTVAALANATTADVLRLWSGLGYNRRALYLKHTAEVIVKEYAGQFPQDIPALEKLSGIGSYTAQAVACFAFGEQVAVVDTNIRKVILLHFNTRHSGKRRMSASRISQKKRSWTSQDDGKRGLKMTEKEIQQVADQLLPQGKASVWNQALMDYSALVLSKIRQSRPKDDQPLAEKFIGSNRYYRGKLIRLLLQEKEISLAKLGFLLKKDFVDTDQLWLQALLKGLQKDKFIVFRNNIVMIATKE
ncbi:MAG: A/G-specific adenine glycosylase [Candidatus Levybacteria bacterium]|nr:A/G-specific adenine glycosylase [Candidatus Levybacteria bacterium]